MDINFLFLIIGLALGAGIATILFKRRISKLSLLSKTDDLTGIRNYRDLNEVLASSINKVLWRNTNHVFILIDLDNFKAINDNMGYDKGDETLVQFTEFISQQIRQSDLLFRYKQGDEFVLIIKSSIEGVEIMMNRINTKLKTELPQLPTFSYGYCSIIPNEINSTINRAEVALRKMKQS